MQAGKCSHQDYRLSYEEEPSRLLRVRVTRPEGRPEDLPSVVVLHGFKGFLRWGFFPELQERLAGAGFQSVAVNLSGSGVGEDLEHFTDDQGFFNSTPSRDLEDLERVLEALRSGLIPGADEERLGILGHSRGGGSAILHAERSGAYRALVTWASVAASNRFDAESLARWREEGVLLVPNARLAKEHRMGLQWLRDVEENAAALDILAACARARTAALLIHGEADQAVPVDDLEALAAAYRPGLAETLRIPKAGHTFGAVHPWQGSTPELEQAIEASLAFLKRHLGKA